MESHLATVFHPWVFQTPHRAPEGSIVEEERGCLIWLSLESCVLKTKFLMARTLSELFEVTKIEVLETGTEMKLTRTREIENECELNRECSGKPS